MTPIVSICTDNSLELAKLVNDIALTNLGYLTLSVTIVLAAGGFFYLFNFKPLQRSIEEQDSELKSLKREIETKTDELRETAFFEIKETKKQSENFIEEARTDFKKIKMDHQISDLNNTWRQHYMWEGRKVHMNTLLTLSEYIRKYIKYDISVVEDDLLLRKIEETINKIGKIDKDNHDTARELLNSLDSLNGDEEKIQKTKDVIQKAMS